MEIVSCLLGWLAGLKEMSLEQPGHTTGELSRRDLGVTVILRQGTELHLLCVCTPLWRFQGDSDLVAKRINHEEELCHPSSD